MTKSNNEVWIEPSIKELGSAKELIKGLSPVWDSKTSLIPVMNLTQLHHKTQFNSGL